MSDAGRIHHVAIVGAGRMGIGIGENLVIGGLEVTFVDADPELSAGSRDRLLERMCGHVKAGLIHEREIIRAQETHVASDIGAAIAEADLIIEAVTEDLEVKREVLGACDAAAREGAILASNTSSLSITELVGFVNRPERFLGMHWFNPPEWTPGVEVVPTDQTEPWVVERVVELLRAIGKQPSTVLPSVGFIANRLQMALFSEAARCVEDGLASPREIDEVVRSCFGFRLPFFGPFQIADMAGLNVYEAVLEQHRRAFGERFLVPEMLRERVRDGRFGTSSGSGFYDYPGDSPGELLVERDRRYAALSQLLSRTPPPSFDGGAIAAGGEVKA